MEAAEGRVSGVSQDGLSRALPLQEVGNAMARDDDHSLAHWLEKMIQAEHERREAKSQTR